MRQRGDRYLLTYLLQMANAPLLASLLALLLGVSPLPRPPSWESSGRATTGRSPPLGLDIWRWS